MIWKIYFVLISIFAVVSILGVNSSPANERVAYIINSLIFIGEVVGVYSYVYQRKILTPRFWKGFFLLNVVLDSLFFLYNLFPHAPFIQLFSYLVPGSTQNMTEVLFGILFDLPLLYALLKISNDEFITTKKKTLYSSGVPKWGMIQTALWGYSLIVNIVFALSSLLPVEQTLKQPPTATDTFYAIMVVIPIFFFWLSILNQYKLYKWNWWRVTLAANGLLYSGMMVYGSVITSVGEDVGSGFDYIAILQFIIIFCGLLVFGKDQFRKNQKKKHIETSSSSE